MISQNELLAMSNIDVSDVNPTDLVDIADVNINESLPQSERLSDFVKKIKNPYCFKVGETIVKVKFSDTSLSREELLKSYLSNLV